MEIKIVAGLAFGDEGKGALVNYLSSDPRCKYVVRFNGGSQTAHNVVVRNGDKVLHHRFSLLGSGSFNGVPTILTRRVLLNVDSICNEIDVFKETSGISDVMVFIDNDCAIVTAPQVMMNRIRELAREGSRHGSVGLGIGETRGDQISGFFITPKKLIFKFDECKHVLSFLVQQKINEATAIIKYKERYGGRCCDSLLAQFEELNKINESDISKYLEFIKYKLLSNNNIRICDTSLILAGCNDDSLIVFEGAQGVLIDEKHGFQPHTTWTNCTFDNAFEFVYESLGHLKKLGESKYEGVDIEKIGILRTHFTRHGDGPFPSEDVEIVVDEKHNGFHEWSGVFRFGRFDHALAGKSISITRPDSICLTHCDYQGYGFLSNSESEICGVPIKYKSFGPFKEDYHVTVNSD